MKISNKTLATENEKKDKEESDVITESDETDNVKHSEKGRIPIKRSLRKTKFQSSWLLKTDPNGDNVKD